MRNQKGRDWDLVAHEPVWINAPLRVDRAGNTKPGFLCIHDLENGNGLCGSNTFEKEDSLHHCIVRLRGRLNFSRPCYDKPHRCPGWAGGGWKGARHSYCRGDGGYLSINYESMLWKWRSHTCQSCGVVVLPYAIHWTSWRSWWYSVRFARNSWMWLIKLETKWGKMLGWW